MFRRSNDPYDIDYKGNKASDKASKKASDKASKKVSDKASKKASKSDSINDGINANINVNFQSVYEQDHVKEADSSIKNDYQAKESVPKPAVMKNDYQVKESAPKPVVIKNDYQVKGSAPKPVVIKNDYQVKESAPKPVVIKNDYQVKESAPKPVVIKNDYQVKESAPKPAVMKNEWQVDDNNKKSENEWQDYRSMSNDFDAGEKKSFSDLIPDFKEDVDDLKNQGFDLKSLLSNPKNVVIIALIVLILVICIVLSIKSLNVNVRYITTFVFPAIAYAAVSSVLRKQSRYSRYKKINTKSGLEKRGINDPLSQSEIEMLKAIASAQSSTKNENRQDLIEKTKIDAKTGYLKAERSRYNGITDEEFDNLYDNNGNTSAPLESEKSEFEKYYDSHDYSAEGYSSGKASSEDVLSKEVSSEKASSEGYYGGYSRADYYLNNGDCNAESAYTSSIKESAYTSSSEESTYTSSSENKPDN